MPSNTSPAEKYVNSLVEQDNVKVLLVANENEMLKYNGDAKELPLFEQEWSDEEGGSHSLKHPLRKYLTVKEKTVSDTIQYTGDYEGAVSQIIKSFGNPILDKFAMIVQSKLSADLWILLSITICALLFSHARSVRTSWKC